MCEKTDTNRLKPGSLIMIKGNPCKVTETTTAKPGKHGSAKAMIVGKDIFTDKQYEETFHTTEMIPAPIVSRTEYMLCDVTDEGALSLMDNASGDIREDLDLPENAKHLSGICREIKKIYDAQKKECLVTVQKWGDKEQVYSVREGADF